MQPYNPVTARVKGWLPSCFTTADDNPIAPVAYCLDLSGTCFVANLTCAKTKMSIALGTLLEGLVSTRFASPFGISEAMLTGRETVLVPTHTLLSHRPGAQSVAEGAAVVILVIAETVLEQPLTSVDEYVVQL